MKSTTKRGFIVLLLVAFFSLGLVYLAINLGTNAEKWATLRANTHLVSDGSFIGAGNVLDRNGEILAETIDGGRVYNNSERIRRSTLHIVGDSEGYIASGVQSAYKRELIGYNLVTGIYSLKKYERGNDVTLTIDASVSATALEALGSKKGIIAVCNYETGEILCSVSSPNFDIRNKPSTEKIEENKNGEFEGLYLNRLIDGLYTPGSVFKIITAACALENIPDIDNWEYECEGEMFINGVSVSCPREHGDLDLEKAFSESCNCAFAELSKKLNPTQITNTANTFGFGKSFAFGNSFTEESILNLTDASSSDVAWAAVGQYTTLANPYHMLTIAGAIANGGTVKLPFVVKSIASPSGRVIKEIEAEESVYTTPETAKRLEEMMRGAVKDNYGDWNFSGMTVCGKTGTAEVSDTEKPHSWFLGFSQDENCPLAIVVVVENGGWGATTAIPIASKVMKAASKAIS
ncbi:MAG: penicillin-binding protein [Clostridia bacterium]|nr:penicillin-binding protein [Clostridia bacterium]